MKQFASILLFLLMIVVYHTHANDLSKNSFSLNPVFFTNEISVPPNVTLFQGNLYYEQDSNDLDSFETVFVLNNSTYNFQLYKIENVAVVFQRLQPVLVIELLLDLPPPMLSV